ncbi:BRCT domain-containing protein, partial [Blautia wexlerae]|uniref:BRCT domain-containing protein n=1 Tax=Blautia wexlerae TaxID=418240 RepID=UPI0034A5CDD3
SEFNFKTQDKSLTNKTNILQDKTFVITGSLEKYSNRDELKSIIESNGGKVSGSVSAKTFALINNDIESSSSKNKKAKSLGVQIINEEQFIQLLN